jgi:hypothetical protein
MSAIVSNAQPLNDTFNTVGQIVGRCGNCVVAGLTFVDKRVVDKMEVRLPCSTVIFDVVSKCCTLHEGMVEFSDG